MSHIFFYIFVILINKSAITSKISRIFSAAAYKISASASVGITWIYILYAAIVAAYKNF